MPTSEKYVVHWQSTKKQKIKQDNNKLMCLVERFLINKVINKY